MRFSEINKPKLNEDVGGNYLYHATGGLKKILSTGRIFPAHGPQDATKAQTTLPTVSTTRDWNYASGGESETEGVDSNAVIVLDRNAVESNFKTLGTSQSRDVRGLAHPQQTNLDAVKTARSYDVDNNKVLNKKDADELFAKGSILGRDGKPVSREVVGRTAGAAKQGFYSSKAGGEFEEAIVVPETGLPIARTMFGFWVNPQSQLTKDPEVMNDPRRLELAPGGTGRFVKAKQQQGVSEDANPKRQAAIAIAMKKAGKKPKGVAEGQEQTPDQVRQTLNAWMNKDQQFKDPTERAPFQAQVWPYIQQNIKTIFADKGADGKGSYPAAPYAAWLLVQHMDATPNNQSKFASQLEQAGLDPTDGKDGEGKLQFIKDRAAVNQEILILNDPEKYLDKHGKPLNNPTADVRDPNKFDDAGIVATSRDGALKNAIQYGNKLLVAAVQATKAQTQPSYKQGVAEGLPGSLSKSDYTPGATVKKPNTSCKRCNGRGTLWKTPDGKILPANDVPGAKKYKCGACDGIGMAKKEVDESNEFTDARMNAIKADKDTFVVHGKTYKVTGDTTDEREASFSEGENWSKHNNKRAGGMSKKSVSVYRREHPGSKIQTAVTTKPSKLKKGSKSAKRRASFCARMRGMKKHRTGAKTAHDPNSNINKSLRRWHCESIEELHELVMIAEQFIRNNKK